MYVVLKTDAEKETKAKIEVPGLLPQTPEEHLEYGLAEKRKLFRMQRDKRVQEFSEEGEMSVASGEKVSGNQPCTASVPVAAVDFTELVLPFHANHMGNTFGGQIMNWMAKGASAAVWLHLKRWYAASLSDEVPEILRLQPVAIDQVHFKKPSHVGDRVQIHAVVTRVFESSLEVLVRVHSAGVATQDNPAEINVGYFTYAVSNGTTLLQNTIADVLPDTVEKRKEYKQAVGRQQFRVQRQETMAKPVSALSGLKVDFAANAHEAEEIGVMCVSSILRIKESTDLRWETLPEKEKGVTALVDLGLKISGAQTRLKLVGTIRCRPRACYDMLRDTGQRKQWDPTCLEIKHKEAVGDEVELVHMIMATPRPGPAGKDATTTQRDVVLLRAWREDNNTGSFVVASRSVRDDSKPASPGVERGQLLPTGYICAETPGTGGEMTDLTFVGQFDYATFEFARPHLVTIFQSFKRFVEAETVAI